MKKMKPEMIVSILILWGIVCLPGVLCGQEPVQETLPVEMQASESERSDESELKVGVVLSGGGARGFAHIGALKVLEEVGLPIDYIVGTSMGSIVGGLYAIGYSAEEIDQVVTEVDWIDLFSDTPPRNLWSYQKKRVSSKYMLGVGFTKKGFVVPQGLTAGQKVSNLLAFLTLAASDIERFDDLPIPYRAVAADIVTAEEVVLDRGSLADAMRSSMAVPGVFTPITLGEHLLVDGGVVKNLPVDIAKQMGADVIVAVDVSSPLKGPEELGNPLSILNQMIALQILKSTEEQRKLADIVILTDLEAFSSTDFGHGPEIIALGEKAAREKLNELRTLAQKVAATRSRDRTVIRRVAEDAKDIYVKDIIVEGNTLADEQLLLQQLEDQQEKPLNPDLLERKITEIFSTGKYETVKFSLLPDGPEGKTLKLQLQEREQGAHQLRVGMNYEARFDDAESDRMIFLVNATLNNVTTPGASWSTDLQFVNVNRIESEYFQPLIKGFFFAPRIVLSNDFQTLYEDKRSVARYDKDVLAVEIRFGTFIRRFGEFSMGYLFENINVVPTSALLKETFPEFDERLASFTVRSRLDMFDTFPFPTSGRILSIDYQLATRELGGSVDFHRLSIEYWGYLSVGKRHTFGLRLNLGTDFNTKLRPYKHFTFGGRDSFVGYKIEELTGAHLGTLMLEYRNRFYELPSAVGGGIFAILMVNIGNVWDSVEEMTDNFELRYGGSAGIGVDTLLGPVRADFAVADGGRQAIYLNIGYKF